MSQLDYDDYLEAENPDEHIDYGEYLAKNGETSYQDIDLPSEETSEPTGSTNVGNTEYNRATDLAQNIGKGSAPATVDIEPEGGDGGLPEEEAPTSIFGKMRNAASSFGNRIKNSVKSGAGAFSKAFSLMSGGVTNLAGKLDMSPKAVVGILSVIGGSSVAVILSSLIGISSSRRTPPAEDCDKLQAQYITNSKYESPTESQMKGNASYIYATFIARGKINNQVVQTYTELKELSNPYMSPEAIAGLNANAIAESSLMPDCYEYWEKVGPGGDMILSQSHGFNWDLYTTRMFSLYESAGKTNLNKAFYAYYPYHFDWNKESRTTTYTADEGDFEKYRFGSDTEYDIPADWNDVDVAYSKWASHKLYDATGTTSQPSTPAADADGNLAAGAHFLPGIGLWQWTGARAYDLQQFGNMGLSSSDADYDWVSDNFWTINTQLAFLMKENFSADTDNPDLMEYLTRHSRYQYDTQHLVDLPTGTIYSDIPVYLNDVWYVPYAITRVYYDDDNDGLPDDTTEVDFLKPSYDAEGNMLFDTTFETDVNTNAITYLDIDNMSKLDGTKYIVPTASYAQLQSDNFENYIPEADKSILDEQWWNKNPEDKDWFLKYGIRKGEERIFPHMEMNGKEYWDNEHETAGDHDYMAEYIPIYETLQDLYDQIKQTKQEIADTEAAIEAKKAEIEAKKAEIAAQEIVVANKYAEMGERNEEYEAALATYTSATTTYNNAVTAQANAQSAYDTAVENLAAAQSDQTDYEARLAAYNSAYDSQKATYESDRASAYTTAYNAALAAYNAECENAHKAWEQTPADKRGEEPKFDPFDGAKFQSDWNTANPYSFSYSGPPYYPSTPTTSVSAAQAALEAADSALASANTTLSSAESAYTAAKGEYESALEEANVATQAYNDEVLVLNGLNDDLAQLEAELGTESDPHIANTTLYGHLGYLKDKLGLPGDAPDKTGSLYAQRNYWQIEINKVIANAWGYTEPLASEECYGRPAVEYARWFCRYWEVCPDVDTHVLHSVTYYEYSDKEEWWKDYDGTNYNSVTKLMHDNVSNAAMYDMYYSEFHKTCAKSALDMSSIAACAMSWAWPQGFDTYADCKLPDPSGMPQYPKWYRCTSLYIACKRILYQGDEDYFSSCDRGGATAVAAAGADDDFPVGDCDNQVAYLKGAGSSKWEYVGCITGPSSWAICEPGDIVLNTGHTTIFVGEVGTELAKEKWPDIFDQLMSYDEINMNGKYAIVHSALSNSMPADAMSGSRGPMYEPYCSWMENYHKGPDGLFEVYRLKSDDSASSAKKALLETYDLSQYPDGSVAGITTPNLTVP